MGFSLKKAWKKISTPIRKLGVKIDKKVGGAKGWAKVGYVFPVWAAIHAPIAMTTKKGKVFAKETIKNAAITGAAGAAAGGVILSGGSLLAAGAAGASKMVTLTKAAVKTPNAAPLQTMEVSQNKLLPAFNTSDPKSMLIWAGLVGAVVAIIYWVRK